MRVHETCVAVIEGCEWPTARETLAMQVKTDDLGWMLNPMFFGSLYDELAKK